MGYLQVLLADTDTVTLNHQPFVSAIENHRTRKKQEKL